MAPSMTDIPMLSESMIRRMKLAADLTQERQTPRLITTRITILNIGCLLGLGISFSHALSKRDFLQQELPVAWCSARELQRCLPSSRGTRKLSNLWELQNPVKVGDKLYGPLQLEPACFLQQGSEEQWSRVAKHPRQVPKADNAKFNVKPRQACSG